MIHDPVTLTGCKRNVFSCTRLFFGWTWRWPFFLRVVVCGVKNSTNSETKHKQTKTDTTSPRHIPLQAQMGVVQVVGDDYSAIVEERV